MDASHLSPRRTALLALAVVVLALVAAVVLESGQAPVAYALRANGPIAVLAAIPLLWIVIALRRGPSRTAFALGVAYPLAIVVSFVRATYATYQSGTEGQMEVLFSLFFFWASATWAIFLVAFLPLMLRLAVVSWRAIRASYERVVVPVIAWTVVLMVAIGAARRPVRSAAEDVPQYRPDVVDNAIAPLNECIWRAAGPGAEAGFPETLAGIRHVAYRVYPTSATRPRDECTEQYDRIPKHPFDVSYEPGDRDGAGRARRFTLRLTEKTRASGRPKVVWMDESGLRRDGVGTVGGRIDSVYLASARSLYQFLILQHLIDEYAAQHGGEPPERVIPDFRVEKGASAPEGALVADVGECSGYDDALTSCVERSDRAIVYTPVRGASGRVTAYTLTMQPVTYYDYEREQPIPSRTHHRDARGALHSFGGFRAAGASDPAPAADELARARADLERFLEDRARESRR